MATHSSILAWRIQGQGSLVGCRLWDHTVGHDWSDSAAAAAVFKVNPKLLIYPPISPLVIIIYFL